MEGVKTHMETLEAIFDNLNIESVLEFGCGLNSTPLFLDRVKKVKSIEMQNVSWYEKVRDKYKSNDFTLCLLLGGLAGIALMKDENLQYDLIFVDGHGDTRPEVINEATMHTNLIVVHDTQEKSYGWNRVAKNKKGWSWIDITTHSVYTSVFTSRNDVKNIFSKWA